MILFPYLFDDKCETKKEPNAQGPSALARKPLRVSNAHPFSCCFSFSAEFRYGICSVSRSCRTLSVEKGYFHIEKENKRDPT
jgi:hypothetical protein